jgi:Myosin N-terminal SH3-like domain
MSPFHFRHLFSSFSQTFEAGSWAWIPDPKEMYLPGKVQKTFKAGEDGKVKMEDGKVSFS